MATVEIWPQRLGLFVHVGVALKTPLEESERKVKMKMKMKTKKRRR